VLKALDESRIPKGSYDVMRSMMRFSLSATSKYLTSSRTAYPSIHKLDDAAEMMDVLMNILVRHDDIVTDEVDGDGKLIRSTVTGFKFNLNDIVKLLVFRNTNLPMAGNKPITIGTTIDGSKLSARIYNVISVLKVLPLQNINKAV